MKYLPKIIDWINQLGKINGKVWIALWGIVALVRFAMGLSIDWAFLGVLGIYAVNKTITKKYD